MSPQGHRFSEALGKRVGVRSAVLWKAYRPVLISWLLCGAKTKEKEGNLALFTASELWGEFFTMLRLNDVQGAPSWIPEHSGTMPEQPSPVSGAQFHGGHGHPLSGFFRMHRWGGAFGLPRSRIVLSIQRTGFLPLKHFSAS